ncbi:MAG: segregation/condensation protein A [Rhodopseudomonas palustris]|nr:segregation/condensation protein A [Rhodopseudomonas palustris]
MRELDLEVAGEFILMAATLIQIKVKMLLPRAPRRRRRKRIRAPTWSVSCSSTAGTRRWRNRLQSYEERQSRVFHRSYFEWQKPYRQKEVVLKDMTMFDLLSAFRDVLSNMPKVRYHEVKPIGVTIEEQIDYVLNGIGDKGHVLFRDLLAPITERIILVVTFMAILELIKAKRISVRQSDVFGEIFIMRRRAGRSARDRNGRRTPRPRREAAGPPA